MVTLTNFTKQGYVRAASRNVIFIFTPFAAIFVRFVNGYKLSEMVNRTWFDFYRIKKVYALKTTASNFHVKPIVGYVR